ncbi:MAG: ATP-dependent helicase, partial [Desulfamplus sp.]|nr:ATP-dependent helicase [Desulfamplus sp.]
DRKTAGFLNPEQQQAINSRNRPLLMEAGPGTGKTRTLTEKIASLIINDNVKPQSILALTFTNKAAEEMRLRIARLVPQKSKQKDVFTSTFHGFCLTVLKEYTDYKFAIADDTLRKALIDRAIKLAFPDSYQKISSKKTELDIAMLKQGNFEQENLEQDNISTDSVFAQKLNCKEICSRAASILDPSLDSEITTITMPVLAEYQKLLLSYQLVDFEDLMVMVLNLLGNNVKRYNGQEDVREKDGVLSRLKERFRYIFVDEYQDINKGQYQLIKLLAGEGKNLCVIGDPDQSIYGFRGADNRYFKRFEQDYPDTEKIVFKRNYRSTETILEAAFQLITGKDQAISATRCHTTDEDNAIAATRSPETG